ncbi:MAG: lasso peptide biosynthesis B2 protein [Hyphomonadaceae bacterium]
MEYHLAPDVHACSSGDLIVFLDLGRDRYFAAPGNVLELDASLRRVRARADDAGSWTTKLVSQGLVQESVPAAAAVLTPITEPILPRPIAFTAALLWAAKAVDRPFALRPALAMLQRRRAGSSLDPKVTATEAALFASWRPLWPRAFVCLHDTLALRRFLAARGSACDAVFGVQGRPFAAHCWAECEGVVLNDEPEYCASFDVILRA